MTWKTKESAREWRKVHPESTRAYRLKYRYGLTPSQRAQVFEDSDGLCALCYEVPATVLDHGDRWGPGGRRGKVRGALCDKHNRALGAFGDSLEGLQEAMDYLQGGATLHEEEEGR